MCRATPAPPQREAGPKGGAGPSLQEGDPRLHGVCPPPAPASPDLRSKHRLPRGRRGAPGSWWPSAEEIKTMADRKRKSLLILGPRSRPPTWPHCSLFCADRLQAGGRAGGHLVPQKFTAQSYPRRRCDFRSQDTREPWGERGQGGAASRAERPCGAPSPLCSRDLGLRRPGWAAACWVMSGGRAGRGRRQPGRVVTG